MAEPFRASPSSPLVWTVKDAVLALDPVTGELRWRHEVQGTVRKLFPMGDQVVLVLPSAVEIVHLATGELTVAMDTPFDITTAIPAMGGLVVAGPEGAISVNLDGDIRWSVGQRLGGILKGGRELIMEDAAGQVQWKEQVTGSSFAHVPGLLHDGLVSQPDFGD